MPTNDDEDFAEGCSCIAGCGMFALWLFCFCYGLAGHPLFLLLAILWMLFA